MDYFADPDATGIPCTSFPDEATPLHSESPTVNVGVARDPRTARAVGSPLAPSVHSTCQKVGNGALSILAALDPTRSMTMRRIVALTGLRRESARIATAHLVDAGMVVQTGRMPARYTLAS